MNGKRSYANPPIVERIIGVYTDINPEVFQAKMPTWHEKIRSSYPLARPISEWSLRYKNVQGIPMLEPVMPTAEIIQVFWRQSTRKNQFLGMRLRPDRLVFHLEREEGDPHKFEELYPEMEKWIAPWMDHFEVASLKGVSAEYLNRINAVITPQFMESDGRVKLSDALVLFSNIPGRYQTITKPYDCRLTLVIDETKPCYFDVRVHADGDLPGVRVDFMVQTVHPSKALNRMQALEEVSFAHEIILEQFECLFTEQAKTSFKPYAVS